MNKASYPVKNGFTDSGVFEDKLGLRKAKARRIAYLFITATALSVLFLVGLLFSIVSQSFGYVLLVPEVDPASLSRQGVALENLDTAGLVETLKENLSRRRFAFLDSETPLAARSKADLLRLVEEEVVKDRPEASWNLVDSVLHKARIEEFAGSEQPEGRLVFRAWMNGSLLVNPQSSEAVLSGLRGALIGSFSTILLTLLFAFPVGVAAAIWLEEFASGSKLNGFIRLNIYNLAGVPSIIYGMLGLAFFVRFLEPVTSGAIFGAGAGGAGASVSGRTVLSASLTLALLVLPIIIVNAQEALKAVPQTLRQAGLAVGATKWQTIWHHVLPASADRILTGTVLAMSRALGETAPLVVVGASTFLSIDPVSPFSRFTTLPVQIYQWTARPQPEFRHLAAAAILVLLILLITLNSAAVVARNRFRSKAREGI